MGEVRFARLAIQDLQGIAAYLAGQNPKASQRVVLAIRVSIDLLASFPSRGRPAVDGTRVLVVPRFRYVVIYAAEPGRVLILRVFHAARNRTPDERFPLD